ncbi:MAG: hypothetical protein HY876_00410 [Coriobacteriales bacterium]|nr:hypothetical protein [Coriobacteriales bacterium]
MKPENWTTLFAEDPRPWLLECDEPAAVWLTLRYLLDKAPDDVDVVAAHERVLSDPATIDLLDRVRPWDAEIPLSGHDKPEYAPNLLGLLADFGVTADDEPRIASVLETMLEHQDAEGRFQSFGRWRGMDSAVWNALPCDSHAIAETLARFGFADDPRVRVAFERIAADIAETRQGRAWLCRPDPAVGFRGPGSKSDFCPQATLEALRAFSYAPRDMRSADVAAAGGVSLRAWSERATEKPYMFGHGRQFKRGKWPQTWYSALEVVDTIGRYPELWDEADRAVERRALSEVAACVVAYTVGADGRVIPWSCFRGYEALSFGQKRRPSAFATAFVAVALRRVDALAGEIAGVDVTALGSSKGGSGTALPPD